jgi:hypothetical protein
MFSNKRGLFPAYSGLADVSVALPSSPSRSSVARDAEDLWHIHTSEPHVTAESDPGALVPYPDENGFDPSRDYSETSPANTLVNRASGTLSSSEKSMLLSELNNLYTDMLVDNLRMSRDSAQVIKELMMEEAPGALLIYNGNNTDSLIKAYTLTKSLETLIDQKVRDSEFSANAKSEMISFISPCPSVRDALILPNHLIKQRLFGSTEHRDNLEHALAIFDLDDQVSHIRNNPSDSKYADYLEKINFAELELDKAVQANILHGEASRSIENALSQIIPRIKSPEIKNAVVSTLTEVKRKAASQGKKTSKSLELLMGKLRKDLEDLGADSESLAQLVQKEKMHKRDAETYVEPARTPKLQRAHQRPVRELRDLDNSLAQTIAHLHRIYGSSQDPINKSCVAIEMYTVMCMRDCCAMVASGRNDFDACAQNLKHAVDAEVRESRIQPVLDLRRAAEMSKRALHAAKVDSTMEVLNRAKSENEISDVKLDTLKSIIG